MKKEIKPTAEEVINDWEKANPCSRFAKNKQGTAVAYWHEGNVGEPSFWKPIVMYFEGKWNNGVAEDKKEELGFNIKQNKWIEVTATNYPKFTMTLAEQQKEVDFIISLKNTTL